MPRRAIIDSNIVLRYLLDDDPVQSREARKLIDQTSDASLYLPAIVLTEVTWTLRSHFGVPREAISAAIQRFIAQPAISVDAITLDAVARYATTTIDFADCALAAAGAAAGLPIITYDRDFRKFPDVQVKRPKELS